MFFAPVVGNVDAACDPDTFEPRDVIEETAKGRDATGASDQPAMQADGHHLGRTTRAFFVERVETVLQVGFELVARVKALGRGKAHVVGVQCVGDHKLVTVGFRDPIGQVVGVAVGDIVKAAILGDQADGVVGTAPRVPAARGFAGDGGVQALGFGDLGAFLGFGHVLVFDPFQAVAGDFPACVLHGGHLIGAAGKGAGDAVDGDRQAAFGEQAVEPPEPGARAVFVNRFHVPVALVRPGGGSDDFGQEGLGGGISVEHAVFTAFFIVHHELHGDPGPVRPVRLWRARPVAPQIPWIV